MSSPVIEEMLQRLRDLYASTPVATPPATAAALGGVKLKGDLAGSAESPTVPGLAGKAAVAHTHPVAQVDGLPTVLAGKADLVGGKVPSGQLPAIPVSKADVGLGNVDNTSDVAKPVSTAQAAALAGKSNVGHSHSVADVSGLDSALAGKAPIVHSHSVVVDGWPFSLEDIGEEAIRARDRLERSVRAGFGAPVEGGEPVRQEPGDVWVDLVSLRVWRVEEPT